MTSFPFPDSNADQSADQKEPKEPAKHRRVTPEQKEKMLELQGKGRTVIQIATEMGLRRTTVHELLKRTNQMVKSNILKLRRMEKQKKKSKRKKQAHRKELLTDEQVDLVNRWLEEDSLLSMAALVGRLKQFCGVTVSQSYISKVIDDFTYSLARLNLDPTANIVQDQKLVAARQEYAQQLMDLHREYNEHQFVFVNFADFTLVARTTPEDGSRERGAKRCLFNSLGVAMNKDKVLLYNFQFLAMEVEDYCIFFCKLIESMKVDGDLSERAVILLDEEILEGAREDVVTMILDAGYQYLILPKDSAFLNPVERLFSGWKAVTRRANAKDEKALVKAIEEDPLINQSDCQHCFSSFLSTMVHCYLGKWYDPETTVLSFDPVKE